MREWKFFYKFESKDQIFAFTKSNQIPYQYLDKNLHNVNSAKSSKVKLTFKWCSLSVYLRHLWGNINRNTYLNIKSIKMRMNGLYNVRKEERNLSDPFEKGSDRLYHVKYMV